MLVVVSTDWPLRVAGRNVERIVTVCEDVLARYGSFSAKLAVITCAPTASELRIKLAAPLVTVDVPSEVVPS